MIISRFAQLKAAANPTNFSTMRQLGGRTISEIQRRNATHFRSGALKPKPEEMPFGMMGVVCAVVPGLFIGAAISKSVANFLEENDLFVPEDDDDDED
ncbi:essential MCU regulator, mitochondrial [Lucilia cuprina]|uniref:essential MCU regulator, mitochondrial n=1 Tax=Lucilia cuprina TaxID=7375 RepID=UPI001F0651F1|nr:essential MCU regulator, mitochondrial [Lucilia cuprina]